MQKLMWDTKNIYCEEEVFAKETGLIYKGDMKKDYDYMAYVSYKENLIYFYDARILRQIYKKGEYKEFHYPTTISFGRLLNMSIPRKYGALMGKIQIMSKI